MEYPYFRRQQRLKGKQTLLVLLLLAVSVWLVYQIKHSINKNAENYGGETERVEQSVAATLGRKVILPSWLEEIAQANSINAHVAEAKNTDSDREYVFDGTMKDKVEIEFEGKQVEKEMKTPSANDSQCHVKEPETQIREAPNVVQNREETMSDDSVKESDNDEETNKISEEEAKMQQNEDGVHSFQDENGFPSDENEIELVGGQKLVKEIV
ncbi:hypothetical protein L6164_005222 [Bauhinia variegata]|uniref:Uncharacterized protein n=1 Tax=Bauhinia variegata TaxID=167791 RepID=A0ACB9PQN2_BAUVA|nr:hypothetical protein L6164_005222 [Bauhinia variegata]